MNSLLVYVSATFLVLRAIGDFKYLGFFKKVKHTSFSYYDTRFYSPLCLFLAISFLLTVV
ncbi:hypothetical protein ASG89_13045 [Paenibacillus sp. Soil766]|uniref:DUF3995 domain-containing protein n=1 Tax=Paenibacillus sp. Soil766 TaxID=1736404 RepID=UPI00070BE1D4|nr:DUF3995 domain-containing protein [Paenibacillus sp. Soil766]KRE83053.1 hypothetical protein ASG89_13045 [Paenibacillus sp. Soil766]